MLARVEMDGYSLAVQGRGWGAAARVSLTLREEAAASHLVLRTTGQGAFLVGIANLDACQVWVVLASAGQHSVTLHGPPVACPPDPNPVPPVLHVLVGQRVEQGQVVPPTSAPPGPTRTVVARTGLEGMVLLGPISPVERAGVPNDRPYQATLAVLNAAGQAVAHVQSGPDGHFWVALPPGTYTLHPEAAGILPRAADQTVTVPATGFTHIVIRYDSGIR